MLMIVSVHLKKTFQDFKLKEKFGSVRLLGIFSIVKTNDDFC